MKETKAGESRVKNCEVKIKSHKKDTDNIAVRGGE